MAWQVFLGITKIYYNLFYRSSIKGYRLLSIAGGAPVLYTMYSLFYLSQRRLVYLTTFQQGSIGILYYFLVGSRGILYCFPVGELWYTLLPKSRSKQRYRKVRPSIWTKVILNPIGIIFYWTYVVQVVHCVIWSMYIMYYALCTIYYVIYRWYCVLCTVYTMYCVLCILYSVLCTQQYSGILKRSYFLAN